MLLARRSFLERGHYRPLVNTIGALTIEHLAEMARGGFPIDRCGILDVGCGEGYYLDGLRDYINHSNVTYLGMDIAKDAVRLAAKRRHDLHVAVADIHASLPFADRSMSVLLNIFAPHHPREFARILAPASALIVVIPTSTHLSHLRAALPLLGIEEEKQRRTIARFSDFFEIVAITTIEYEIDLRNAELLNLVHMTPSARHLAPSAIDAMGKMESIRAAVGFDILTFRNAPR